MPRVPDAAALLLLAAGAIRLAAQSPPERAGQTYSSATSAILVDVVVRDRQGRPVMDLTADDFSVSEDGVPQRVDTFTRVSRGGGIGVGIAWKTPEAPIAVTTSPAAASDGDTGPEDEANVALVFDHLSSETLRLAQRATLDYVPMTGDSPARIAIFATDPGLRVLQPYTTDRALVRKAVERVLPSGTAAEEQKGERQDALLSRRKELEGQTRAALNAAATVSGAAAGRNSSAIGQRENELKLVETELAMMRSFDNLDRDHRGYDTALALASVVETLTYQPGRKTIVLFSEGLPVSPALSARLDAVIDAANRANVTAYAIDANGLHAKSTSANMNKELEAFTDDRFSQLGSGSDRTTQPLTMAFERIEDTMKLDSRTGLARLAADTGGFLVGESNDLSSAFRRIDEDNRFHYLLTYSPKNTDFDGRFRRIDVKVRRPATQVFARKGYRAVRAPAALDTAAYARPALALLDRAPLPNAFPVYAAGFSFPDPARPGLTPVLVHVGTGALRFVIDPRRSSYSAQAAIVVRIRDAEGREIQKLSQEYVFSGDGADVDAARRGDILFYREVDLVPGVYTLESVVFDANAGQGSVRVGTLNVPSSPPRTPSLSSLVLVNRVEETREAPGGGANAIAPLYVGRTLLYPNLGEPIRKGSTPELPFYFTLYGNSQGVRVSAQLLRNGTPVAEAPVPLASPTNSRVQHVGRLGVGTLPAGTYEFRIRVELGGREVSRSAFFTLE